MCGIAGIILPKGQRIQEDFLKEVSDQMQHRGPDNQGLWYSENIGLVHQRLSIIDLSNHAHQPMLSNDSQVILTYNGEVYNFNELKDELEKLGYSFKTKSDTEVVLNAYLAWGKDSFEKLNGMFAFAILDLRKSEKPLYLVRDRAGIKPLFYSSQQNHFAFSSELKPLMKCPWISKEIAPQAVFYFLKHSHVPTPLSIFRSVTQLKPGTWIKISNGQITHNRYWSSDCFAEVKSKLSFNDAKVELDHVINRVMKRQLISDVPIGCFLSGGIDSSLLVSYMAKLQSATIKTFSIGYKEAEFDESYYAKIVAHHFNTDHHEIIVSPSDLFEVIEEVPQYFDQPFADPTVLPTMSLSKFAKQEVTVALSGDGGDELFFGYTYQQILLKIKYLCYLPYPLRKIIFKSAQSLIQLKPGILSLRTQQLLKFLDILQFRNAPELFQYFIGTIGPISMPRLEKLFITKVQSTPSIYTQLYQRIKHHEWHSIIEEIFYETFMLDTVLAKSDRASMAYSLETRVPFLDNELINYAATLPFHHKYYQGTKKYILRELLRDHLPSEIIDRKKQGFSIPMREWLKKDLYWLIEKNLNPDAIQSSSVFNQHEVKKIIDEHMNDRMNHSHLLWSLISYQMWSNKYIGQ